MNLSDLIVQGIVLGSLGLGAGVLGGVIGFGTTIILMPALVYFYGPIQAIPVIALAGTVEVFSLIKSPGMIEWQFLVGGACIAGFSGYACMHYFLKLVDHIGLWPFVLYRLGLGLVLLST